MRNKGGMQHKIAVTQTCLIFGPLASYFSQGEDAKLPSDCCFLATLPVPCLFTHSLRYEIVSEGTSGKNLFRDCPCGDAFLHRVVYWHQR